MYEIIGTNYAWVSPNGFFDFCKVVSTLEFWDGFTRADLEKKYSTTTAHHKVRSNLGYATSLGIITKINGHYKIEHFKFFQLEKEGKEGEAKQKLKEVVEQHPFFKKILTDFFFDKKTKSIKELREFMRLIDGISHKARHYSKGANFFAKFLDEIGLVEYHQRRQALTTKSDRIPAQKRLVEVPIGTEIHQLPKFQDILNEISVDIKAMTIENKNELAKLINIMPEHNRVRYTEKLLEIINNP
ncbi:hypothetical protein HYX08_07005 [Candidatus Woesearchaeota archaeon]|nr:hypothetical protein [Candidatus Woesearchaeota archaeon]